MTTAKQFFDQIADEILTECATESDYVKVYQRIKEYKANHAVKPEDMYSYFDSGAAEVLGIATQRYREKE